VGDDLINEFTADGVLLTESAAKTETALMRIHFHPYRTLFLSNGQWKSIPLDAAKIADVDALIGNGRALLIVPMTIPGGAATVQYDPPRPNRPRPTGGK
jgi:hypothetical protein